MKNLFFGERDAFSNQGWWKGNTEDTGKKGAYPFSRICFVMFWNWQGAIAASLYYCLLDYSAVLQLKCSVVCILIWKSKNVFWGHLISPLFEGHLQGKKRSWRRAENFWFENGRENRRQSVGEVNPSSAAGRPYQLQEIISIAGWIIFFSWKYNIVF